MIKRVTPKSFLDELQNIPGVNRGLFVVWNSGLERFQVFHKDPRVGITRIVLTVENDDGSYRPLDNRTIEYLKMVDWDMIGKFPEPKQIGEEFDRQRRIKKEKWDINRKQFLKDWNRSHRKLWREAINNWKRGIIKTPQEFREKLISTGAGTSRILTQKTIYD